VLPGRAITQIRTNLGREAAKGKLPEAEIEPTLARIQPTLDREELAGADIAVEAASERFEVKAELFRSLDRILPEAAILATNTSSISITKLAAQTHRPKQVIGMHFFNPVPVMTLVEVVRGLATGDETFATVHALAVKLGKTPVEVNDAPGFVSNRVLMPLINEAAFAVMEGVATPEAVDQVFKLGMNHPMGPLTLADFIGLDVCVDILRVLQEGFGDPKIPPLPAAGALGGCRLARPQIRTRLLHLRKAGLISPICRSRFSLPNTGLYSFLKASHVYRVC